ncbi:MAG: winged helix-turn-helix domain-containing protein, partial [Cellulosilyticaceae bacterium]
LYLLANNRGRVYTKDQIYENVWKEHYTCDDSNIMSHIRKLRKKIEPNPTKPCFVVTVWGVGYKFTS